MIKKTLYFGNPAYLSGKDGQLKIKLPAEEEPPDLKNLGSIPIEDIGLLILDNNQITITEGLIAALLENKCAVIPCNSSHMPSGMLLPLDANQTQSEMFKEQISASLPLKKQLWKQTVSMKIRNQAAVLYKYYNNINSLIRLSKLVQAGDRTNCEGRAAAYYWKYLFPKGLEFERDRSGAPPNNLLNYSYAILRAVTARSLVSSGLLPTLGIHHTNKYNAYCLADDIMEPYRPYADLIVAEIVENGEDFTKLTPSIKKQLLELPAVTVTINEETSPLMVAMQRTTASLAKCYRGDLRKISYPEIPICNSTSIE
jgi:CRISPR-associated protein Cas1